MYKDYSDEEHAESLKETLEGLKATKVTLLDMTKTINDEHKGSSRFTDYPALAQYTQAICAISSEERKIFKAIQETIEMK